jgi:hypothetical protein
VHYEEFGRQESFSAGTLVPPSDRRPRWFRFGKSPLFYDLSDQRDLVDDATGISAELDTSVSLTRQTNYLAFCRKQPDNGFSDHQIPLLAYQYHHKLLCIFSTPMKETFVYGGGDRVSRRAFNTAELDAFEDFLRLAIAASNRGGGLRIDNGMLTIKQSTIRSGSITPPPPFATMSNSSGTHDSSAQRTCLFTPIPGIPSSSKITQPRRRRSSASSSATTIPIALTRQALSELVVFMFLLFAMFTDKPLPINYQIIQVV